MDMGPQREHNAMILENTMVILQVLGIAVNRTLGILRITTVHGVMGHDYPRIDIFIQFVTFIVLLD